MAKITGLLLPEQCKGSGIKKSPEMKKSVFLSAWSICIKHKDADIIYLPCLNWLSGLPVRHVMHCKTGLPKAADYISKYCFFKMK